MSTISKAVISDSTEAYNLFREFCRTSNSNAIKLKNSKAKYYTVKQIVDWARTAKNIELDRGWFGRALNKAINAEKQISVNSIPNCAWKGKPISIYRNSK